MRGKFPPNFDLGLTHDSIIRLRLNEVWVEWAVHALVIKKSVYTKFIKSAVRNTLRYIGERSLVLC